MSISRGWGSNSPLNQNHFPEISATSSFLASRKTEGVDQGRGKEGSIDGGGGNDLELGTRASTFPSVRHSFPFPPPSFLPPISQPLKPKVLPDRFYPLSPCNFPNRSPLRHQRIFFPPELFFFLLRPLSDV